MPAEIVLRPIGVVRGECSVATDDDWDRELAVIELDPARLRSDATPGLEEFSHVEVVFWFHLLDEDVIETGVRHLRGRSDWPRVGILAQRARARPNRLGVTTCRLVGVDGLRVAVRGPDAVDGTPVLDLEPSMSGFDARGERHEPAWARELMESYWDGGASSTQR